MHRLVKIARMINSHREIDIHNCMHLALSTLDPLHLAEQIMQARSKQCKAVWLKLASQQIPNINIAFEQGFKMHRCDQSNIWLVLTLKVASIPPFSGASVGCGCICVREVVDGEQILFVEEKTGPRKGSLGLPGGIADPGQSFVAGALRQLKQQTGLQGKFQYLYSVRYLDKLNYGQSDLYFIMVFRIEPEATITLQTTEIASHRWVNTKNIGDIMDRTIGTGKVVIQRLADSGKRGVKFLEQPPGELIKRTVTITRPMNIELLPLRQF